MNFLMASEPKDYEMCQALMEEAGIPKVWGLIFPTVMAFQDRKLVGFLSTRIEDKMIIAGPLVLKSDRRRIFTALRLAEAYESSMRTLGIKTFIFAGEAGGVLDRAIKRYYPHAVPYAVNEDGMKFWTWRIDNGGQDDRSRTVS